jgi:hypothetical protein
MNIPLLTLPVYNALRAARRTGATAVECSLDLERTRSTVEVGISGWTWQGRKYPYLDACRERTIYYWTGKAFEPVQRFTNALIMSKVPLVCRRFSSPARDRGHVQ